MLIKKKATVLCSCLLSCILLLGILPIQADQWTYYTKDDGYEYGTVIFHLLVDEFAEADAQYAYMHYGAYTGVKYIFTNIMRYDTQDRTNGRHVYGDCESVIWKSDYGRKGLSFAMNLRKGSWYTLYADGSLGDQQVSRSFSSDRKGQEDVLDEPFYYDGSLVCVNVPMYRVLGWTLDDDGHEVYSYGLATESTALDPYPDKVFVYEGDTSVQPKLQQVSVTVYSEKWDITWNDVKIDKWYYPAVETTAATTTSTPTTTQPELDSSLTDDAIIHTTTQPPVSAEITTTMNVTTEPATDEVVDTNSSTTKSTGATIGSWIAIGILLALLVFSFIWLLCRRRRQ
jgi:hypothetical protein